MLYLVSDNIATPCTGTRDHAEKIAPLLECRVVEAETPEQAVAVGKTCLPTKPVADDAYDRACRELFPALYAFVVAICENEPVLTKKQSRLLDACIEKRKNL